MIRGSATVSDFEEVNEFLVYSSWEAVLAKVYELGARRLD